MFEGLRRFVADLASASGERVFADTDHRMAAAALLVHVADADGVFDARERERLRRLLVDRFGLADVDAGRLLAQAVRHEHEAVDLDGFVAVLRRACSMDARLRILDMMWEIAIADGAPLEVEESVVWRVGQMLGLPPDALADFHARVGSLS